MHAGQVLLQIAVILTLSRGIARLFRRIGQPAVIAEILAGILLGPSLLGLVWPEGMELLFPARSLPSLELIAQLGLVFFMFLVGLEFDPGLLAGRGRATVGISTAGIAVPFALGMGIAPSLHARMAPEGTPALSFGLFLGAAMSVTAFPVLARILAERGVLRTRVGSLSLACAAVNDVSAWCVLALVVGVASANGPGPAALTTVMTGVYAVILWVLVRPALARLGPREGQQTTTDAVAYVFLALLASAWITEQIGIHALFGGFCLGAVMPRGGGFSHVIGEKMEDFVTIVLLPLFFAYSGLRTELASLDTAAEWMACGAVIGVACLGKLGGTAIAARVAGMSWRESTAVGVLMNTRGLMELVVLNVGLDMGVLSREAFTMMVVMALTTTWIASPLLERVYPASQMTRDAAFEPLGATESPPAALLCVSDPALAASLVALAEALTRADRAPVLALHLRSTERPSEVLRAEMGQDSALLAVEQAAREHQLQVSTRGFASGDPAADIARVASTRQAGLVLLGAHRSAIRGENLGGIAGAIVDACPRPIGVLLPGRRSAPRAVALVGDHPGARAVAERLAAALGTPLEEVASADAIRTADLAVAPLASSRSLPDHRELSWLLIRA